MTGLETVTPALLRAWPLPAPGQDKQARGQVCVVGGGRRSPGAVLLAGEAALRAGAGKLVLATVGAVAVPAGLALPEAGVVELGETDEGHVAPASADDVVAEAGRADAVLLGSGFADTDLAVGLMRRCAPRLEGPLVLDALASAYLTEHPDGLRHLRGRAVLTVNPRELSRTAGREERDVQDDPLPAAAQVARDSGVVVLCGGTAKHVVAPDGRAWVVEGGGRGLGVSGSGDVQAGLVAGLLARGAEPAQAAVWAGHLHARAGERLAAAVGPLGFLARELPGQVPAVLAELA